MGGNASLERLLYELPRAYEVWDAGNALNKCIGLDPVIVKQFQAFLVSIEGLKACLNLSHSNPWDCADTYYAYSYFIKQKYAK